MLRNRWFLSLRMERQYDHGRVKHQLAINREEADTLIYHCFHEVSGDGKSVVVHSYDIDVFVLLLSHAPSLNY